MAKAEQEYLADLPAAQDKTAFARSRFDQLDKVKLREVMYREQRSICIYCERTIQEGHPAPRIDHWKPLSANQDQALRWKNLHLSCPFSGTCDDAKGQRPLKWDDAEPDLPWPIDFAYEKVLGFTSEGEIYVRSDVNLDEAIRRALKLAVGEPEDNNQRDNTILNLNHPSLIAARRAELDREKLRLERDYNGRTATRQDREQRAHELERKNPLPQFVSIRVAWLRKMIGKGR
jgi:uncharacterized protein (TIGR02646 family)